MRTDWGTWPWRSTPASQRKGSTMPVTSQSLVLQIQYVKHHPPKPHPSPWHGGCMASAATKPLYSNWRAGTSNSSSCPCTQGHMSCMNTPIMNLVLRSPSSAKSIVWKPVEHWREGGDDRALQPCATAPANHSSHPASLLQPQVLECNMAVFESHTAFTKEEFSDSLREGQAFSICVWPEVVSSCGELLMTSAIRFCTEQETASSPLSWR